MEKLLRMAVLVGAFVVLQVVAPRTQAQLDCHVVGQQGCPNSPYTEITCDWEEPSECANEEPAYDFCEDICTQCPTGRVDYYMTEGNPCGIFNCWCLPWEQ